MNKKLVFSLGTLTVAGVLGLGVYQSEAAPAETTLSTDEISQLIQDQYTGTITEMEIDKEFNKVVYEVEVKDDEVEYDLKLDGDTGEVLKEEQHKDFDDDTKNTAQGNKANSDLIGDQKVREIALGQFDGTVTDFELDEDDDRLVYEIEIRNGEKEADFEIDAVSGDILEMEIDTEDDDD